ncbi:MAG: TRAP transporter substrate-binding protein, partial [Flavobacteriaceae bacterium]
MTTRRTFIAAGAGGLAAGLAAPALAQQTHEWRMVTSWPKNLPGPGVTAERLARRIGEASGGRLRITVHAAGELVPPLEVFDAVATGTAEMAHTASFFWQGKVRAATFFTAAPFGLTAGEHQAWIDHGGGQAIWDELYAPFGIKPFMGGNTGMQMGGWFRREISSAEDFRGLKMRMPGLGGEVIRKLGATPVSIPPGEIFSALQSGVIDATEFLGPWSDTAMGFHKVAPYYYAPGFHEPNGTGELLISLNRFNALPEDLKRIVEHAAAAENAFALAESEWQNAAARKALVDEHGVKLRRFPDGLRAAARKAAA